MSALSISSSPAPNSLVRAVCSDKLEALGREGGIARDSRTALQALGAAALFFFVAFLLLSGWLTPQDASPWLRGLYPLALFGFPIFGCFGLVFAIGYGVRALRAGSSGSFEVRCPKCSTENFSLSAIHKRKFALVCPDCFTLVTGNSDAYNVEHQCEYCELRYFAGPQAPPDCPSCGYRKDRGSITCPGCQQPIPKGVLFCRSCRSWRQPEYSTALKDFEVTRFSHGSCTAYLGEVTNRLDTFATALSQLLASHTSVQGLSLDVYDIGRIGGSFVEPTEFLRICALATEWLALPGATPPVELMTRLEVVLASLAASVEQLNAAHVSRSEKIWPVLQAARDAVSAAFEKLGDKGRGRVVAPIARERSKEHEILDSGQSRVS